MTDYLIINAHRQVKTYRNPTGDWLGIHYIAAFLNENGFSALAFAGYAHEVPQLLEKYAGKNNIRAIGFSCDYENQFMVKYFSRFVKEKWGYPVIIGGPQALFLDEPFLVESKADVIIYGEGELSSLKVLHALLDGFGSLRDIKGIKYLEKGKLIVNEPHPLISNLDALPFPNPKYALGNLFRPNLASFLTGRGCPFSCSFCYEGSSTRGIRWRSVENVITEVRQVLSQRHDIHYIMFVDDTFTVDESRVHRFCEELSKLREKFHFSWFCEGHVRTLYQRKELLREMVNAGMFCLQIGIESGDNDVLSAYNKQITTDMIEDVVKNAFEVGLEQMWGNIILGGAMETAERIEKNISFCKHLFDLAPGMLNMDVVYFWPLPGTRITTNPSEYGMKILDLDSMSSNLDFPVVEYPGIGIQDFCNYRSKFMRELKQHAISLVSEIPIERAKKLLFQINNATNFSIWKRIIAEEEAFLKFFYLLAEGASALSCNIPEAEIKEMHPMRTGAPELFTKDDRVVICNSILSKEETLIFCSASGKRNTEELYQTLSDHFSWDDFLRIMKSLEKKRLFTFSRY